MRRRFISSSILTADFARLGEDIEKVLDAGVDIIHFDVMDNHYVPNLTIGSMVLKSLRNYGISAPIDVHLMVKPVDSIIPSFISAGANSISFHPETSDHIDRTLCLIKDNGCKAGLALNPATSLTYLDYIMGKLDLILLMSVNPGFSGQSFIVNTLEKIRKVRQYIDRSGYQIQLGVDGGIQIGNIRKIASAGVDLFIIGSTIFNQTNYKKTVKKIFFEINKV